MFESTIINFEPSIVNFTHADQNLKQNPQPKQNIFPSLYLEKISEKLLEPLKRNESVFVWWFPGNGKTALLKQIFSPIRLSEFFGKNSKKIIFINISSYVASEEELKDYFKLVYEDCVEVFEKNNIHFTGNDKNLPNVSLIHNIKRINKLCGEVIASGYELVFVLDGVDDISDSMLRHIFVAWEQIVESDRENIHIHINIIRHNILKDFINQSVLIQNIISIPLPQRRDCEDFMSYYAELWGLRLTDEITEGVFSCCGSDLTLIKEVLRIYKSKGVYNLHDKLPESLLFKAKFNFNYLDDQMQSVIESMVKRGKITSFQKIAAEELVKLNFWNNNYEVSKIFEKMILNNKGISELTYDRQEQSLVLNGVILRNKLTDNEYSVLLLLYKNKKQITGRDEIANCIWSKEADSSYSDWAIDKLVSRLRKKFTLLGSNYQIKTIKKKGFLLEL